MASRVSSFTAKSAWLTLACTAFNILRAAGAAASARHAKARWATLRTHLIAVPARIASTARRLTLHLPKDWPWAPDFEDLWATASPDYPGQTGHNQGTPPWRSRTDRPITHARKPSPPPATSNAHREALTKQRRWIRAEDLFPDVRAR